MAERVGPGRTRCRRGARRRPRRRAPRRRIQTASDLALAEFVAERRLRRKMTRSGRAFGIVVLVRAIPCHVARPSAGADAVDVESDPINAGGAPTPPASASASRSRRPHLLGPRNRGGARAHRRVRLDPAVVQLAAVRGAARHAREGHRDPGTPLLSVPGTACGSSPRTCSAATWRSRRCSSATGSRAACRARSAARRPCRAATSCTRCPRCRSGSLSLVPEHATDIHEPGGVDVRADRGSLLSRDAASRPSRSSLFVLGAYDRRRARAVRPPASRATPAGRAAASTPRSCSGVRQRAGRRFSGPAATPAGRRRSPAALSPRCGSPRAYAAGRPVSQTRPRPMPRRWTVRLPWTAGSAAPRTVSGAATAQTLADHDELREALVRFTAVRYGREKDVGLDAAALNEALDRQPRLRGSDGVRANEGGAAVEALTALVSAASRIVSDWRPLADLQFADAATARLLAGLLAAVTLTAVLIGLVLKRRRRSGIALPALLGWVGPLPRRAAPPRRACVRLAGLPFFILAVADPRTTFTRQETSYPGRRITPDDRRLVQHAVVVSVVPPGEGRAERRGVLHRGRRGAVLRRAAHAAASTAT